MVAAFVLGGVRDIMCGLPGARTDCSIAYPVRVPLVLVGIMLASIGASAYQYYLDFHQFEHYRDLEDPHWRDR